MNTSVIAILMVGMLTVSSISCAANKVSLPKGYEKWAKSKAQVITDRQSLFYGIHYIYVDGKAMKTYQTGGTYPDGSRFVVVNYSIRDEGGKPAEGKKSMVVLMQKKSTEKATGGWLFAGFTPEGKPSGLDPVKICYDCHLKDTKASDLIISKYANFR